MDTTGGMGKDCIRADNVVCNGLGWLFGRDKCSSLLRRWRFSISEEESSLSEDEENSLSEDELLS